MCKTEMSSCSHLFLAEPKESKLLPQEQSSCLRSRAPALLAEQLLLSQGFPGALKAFLLFSFGV